MPVTSWKTAVRLAALSIFSVFSLLAAGLAQAADDVQVRKAAAPAWVIDRPLPTKIPARVEEGRGGASLLLDDHQVRADGDGYVAYSRTAFKIDNRSALEAASRLILTFDPTKEKISFNHVRIIRDGKVIDRLKDLDFSVIRRENSLESGIWTGRLTAVSELKDVRVGDVVDVGQTDEVHNKLYPNQISDVLQVTFIAPIAERHYRLTWPKDRRLKTGSVNTDRKLEVTHDGKFAVYSFDQTDPDPIELEPATPASYPATGFLLVSSAKNWKQIVDWALPLMDIDLSLPKDFAHKIDDITKKWSRPEDRITEALRLVQDTIRYVSISIGDGAIIPRKPKDVIKSGYGDCKDKSMVLLAALRRMKIDAAPALANLSQGELLDQMLPSPNVFNHMIVEVELHGRAYWLDATRSNAGGRFPNIGVYDYGYVLPLRPGRKSLQKVIVPDLTKPDAREERTIIVHKSGTIRLTLSDQTEFYGDSADLLRDALTRTSRTDMAKALEQALTADYPGIKGKGSLGVTDDRDANHLRISRDYEMDRAAFKQADFEKSLDVPMSVLTGALSSFPSVPSKPRTAPLALPRMFGEQVVHVTIEGHPNEASTEFDEKAGPVHFQRTSTADGDEVTITDRIRISADSVPANEAGPILSLAKSLENHEVRIFNLGASKPDANKTLAELFHVSTEELAPYADRLRKIQDLALPTQPGAGANVDNLRKTLPLITALTREVKRPSEVAGLFDSLRGTTLYMLRRIPEAKEALESGYKQYQGLAPALGALAIVRAGTGDYYGSALVLTQIAARDPNLVRQMVPQMIDFVVESLKRDSDDSVSWKTLLNMSAELVNINYQLDPPDALGEKILPIGIQGLVEQGKIDDARTHLPQLTAPDALLALMADKRYQALWPDLEKQAGRDLGPGVDTAATSAKAQYEADQTNMPALGAYILRARLAEKPDAALAEAKRVVNNEDFVATYADSAYRLITDYATALNRTGHPQQALQAIDRLSGIGPVQSPTILPYWLDQAKIMLEDGHVADALSVLNKVDTTTKYRWTAYDQMRLSSLRACAFNELGRPQDAAQDWESMRLASDMNPDAYLYALTCANRQDDLAQALVDGLDNPATRAGTLMRFQRYRNDPPLSGLRAKLHERLMQVEARLEVQLKVKEYGRIIEVKGSLNQWQDF